MRITIPRGARKMSTIRVANSSQLIGALRAAVAGDTIELSAGNYGSVNLKDVNFSSDVTIAASPSGAPAVFSAISATRVSHLVFDRIALTATSSAGQTEFEVTGSSDVTIRNSTFVGYTQDGYG